MPELLFYNRVEAIDRHQHADLCFTPPQDFSFAHGITAVPLIAAEFSLACRHYPILFCTGAEGQTVAVALLALNGQTNLFIDTNGRWTASYIPAFVRRYPFILADVTDQPGQSVLAFDPDSGCFSPDRGQPLFDAAGDPSPLLREQLRFLEEYRQHAARTVQFIRTLQDEGLLRPIDINVVRAGDKARFDIKAAVTVDEVKLNKLPPEKASAYLASGLLGVVHAHLISLQNFGAVANRTGDPSLDVVPWYAR